MGYRDPLKSVYRVAIVADLRMSLGREGSPDPILSGAENRFLPVLEMEDYPDYDPKLAQSFFRPWRGSAGAVEEPV